MKVANKFRWLIAGVILLTTLLFLLFLFFATRTFLDVWERLQQLPEWLMYTYMGLVAVVIFAGIWLIYRLFRSSPTSSKQSRELADEKHLAAEIDRIEDSGMDTSELREEIRQLQARKAAGSIHIALFGDVSTGKSSIIQALLPDAHVSTDLRGGSTRDITTYSWETTSGDQLLLTDLPGRNEADGELDQTARDEAVRAQIVVYVTDSDLSRTQFNDIQELHGFGKPLMIAINKSDLYSDTERHQIATRIQGHFNEKPPQILFVQSGGMEEIVRVYPDGREERVERPRNADVSALTHALQQEIDGHIEWLAGLRDASVFTLVQQKLDETRLAYRRKEAEKIVSKSTKRAVGGALASMAPGTDLVIQGVIGTMMVKELCALYDSPVSDIDIDDFLDFSQGQLKKSIPLVLAVAGNGLKAFPGIGTVAGGLVHAVAYGLIFDALGHAVAHTLEKRGTLKAAPAAVTFREMLSGNLEARTKTLAKLVVDQYRSNGKND